MTETLLSTLNPIYRRLLSPELEKPPVVETRATCDHCEMCDKGTMPGEVEAIFFRPDTKCCTFYPSLPNFLVGAILRDDSPEIEDGRARVRAKIAARIGVMPYCVGPPNKYLVLYRASKNQTFGRSLALRCPYHADDGRCTVWRHRESVCRTFFCKYSGGEPGKRFWQAFKTYLGFVEGSLAVWATREIARDVRQPQTGEGYVTVEDLEDRPPNDAAYAQMWGAWVGREEEFYVACYNKVRNLTRAQFARLVDETPKGKELLADLRTRYAAVAEPRVPERVALNKKLRRLPVANGVVVTPPYNAYDSMLLERDLFDVLSAFTHDATVADVRKKLADEQGVELVDELLVYLANHQILVPPEPSAVDATAADASDAPRAQHAGGEGARAATDAAWKGTTSAATDSATDGATEPAGEASTSEGNEM